MKKNLSAFGSKLRKLRIESGLSLREMSRLTNYDASNLSKIERGRISPPSEERVLKDWARILKIKGKRDKIQEFIDEARIAQGIIPMDIQENNKIDYLPAFFRTMRKERPSKEEIDQLVELIRNA
jgi:transcriptional regulator with XRE-family HTH domain